jgi:selenocysteine-specific elongation factor
MVNLILGTAGHIDHGKTALVRALTGTDTDRLPEERRRGITIELGFAELALGPYRLGIVDVPGHERFVRQMLSGATGMDLAMLVVAADDSVKPQTREHMDVLRLLDLQAGVIALSKCDLADPEWLELVEAEVRELVAGSFLQDASLVRTSSVTGQGLDQLRAAISEAAARAVQSRPNVTGQLPFRMAVDRSFSIRGHGTVVTGSVASGVTRTGDLLVIQPGGVEVRVRGLQNHDRTVACVERGQRAAINLAGIHHDQIQRGHELATPGHLVPSTLVTVELSLLDTAPRPLKPGNHVRVHLGTAEVLATVVPLGRATVQPNQRAIAQLFLRQPVAAVWHQPFVVRSESPVGTIGGGHVLVTAAQKIRRETPQIRRYLEALAQPQDRLQRAAAALYFVGLEPWAPQDLVRLAGITEFDEITEQLKAERIVVELPVSHKRSVWVHRDVLADWGDRLIEALRALHQREPLRAELDRAQLVNRFAFLGDEGLLLAILRQLHQAQRLRLGASGGVALPDHRPRLSGVQRALLEDILEQHRRGAFQPPTLPEIEQAHPKNAADIQLLVELAVHEGKLVRITNEIHLHRETATRLHELVRESMNGSEGMTLSSLRQLLNTSRKYAVPICEYLDRIGITRRKGDLRVLAE